MKKKLERRFKNWKLPKIVDGKPTVYGWIVKNKKKFKLGKNTDIGAFTYINAQNGVTIGDNVQIGSHCSIYSLSTIDRRRGPVMLKPHCKIGSHSVIMPGITVGENTLVGAFSFVNKNLSDNVVAMGVPVKVIKKIKEKKNEKK